MPTRIVSSTYRYKRPRQGSGRRRRWRGRRRDAVPSRMARLIVTLLSARRGRP